MKAKILVLISSKEGEEHSVAAKSDPCARELYMETEFSRNAGSMTTFMRGD